MYISYVPCIATKRALYRVVGCIHSGASMFAPSFLAACLRKHLFLDSDEWHISLFLRKTSYEFAIFDE